jgi:VRR-NUC domain
MRNQIEHDNQVTLVEWAMYNSARYPELRWLYAIPNATASKAQAGKLKAEGMKSGVPDICIPCAFDGFNALYIEMKSDDGRLSEKQIDWRDGLQALGNKVVTCRSVEEAITQIEAYLGKRK